MDRPKTTITRWCDLFGIPKLMTYELLKWLEDDAKFSLAQNNALRIKINGAIVLIYPNKYPVKPLSAIVRLKTLSGGYVTNGMNIGSTNDLIRLWNDVMNYSKSYKTVEPSILPIVDDYYIVNGTLHACNRLKTITVVGAKSVKDNRIIDPIDPNSSEIWFYIKCTNHSNKRISYIISHDEKYYQVKNGGKITLSNSPHLSKHDINLIKIAINDYVKDAQS